MNKRQLAVVIDDEESVRDLLYEILTSLGYETKVFNSPMDIPCIHESCPHDCVGGDIPPTLLITDIQMPEMNGLDFVLHKIEKGCKIKNVAIISGSWDDEQRAIAEKLKCKKFDKPFGFSDIANWVNGFSDNI